MPTEHGPEPTTCPTCGSAVLAVHPTRSDINLSYEPVKPWEDPAAVERAAKVLAERIYNRYVRPEKPYGVSVIEDRIAVIPDLINEAREDFILALRAAGEGDTDG